MTMEDKEMIKVKSKGGGSIINNAPVFSSDGQNIFIIWKNIIQSYNVQTGEKVCEFTGCDNNIVGVALNPHNPMLLVACSSSGEIAVWKWQAQLLLTKSKFNHDMNEVRSFHLLQTMSNDASDSCECDALLYYSKTNSHHIGVFSLKDLTLKRDLPLYVDALVISVQVGGSSNSQYVTVLNKNFVLTLKLDDSQKSGKFKIKGSTFTALACHPEQECIATGDNLGRVFLWRGIFNSGSPARALYHWHTLPVNVLSFSQSGTYLYSGGNECVLVKWRVDTLQKDFLPRLSAPIIHLASVPGNTYLAISTLNNAVHIINARFNITRVIQHFTWAVSVDVGIKVDYRTKSLALNGNVGNIQFYSPHTKSLLYNLDVVGQNKLTEERNVNIPNTNVTKIALTRNSEWLACVEERFDKEIFREIRLKFFQFDETNQQFTLNTSIEYPHENGVNSLEFQPLNSSSLDLLCATTGNDDQFKIWSLVDTTNIYRKSKAWRCLNSANYKNLPSNSLSFSSDGSLLAVAFGPCLTVWSPETCYLKCSLLHPNYKETLDQVQFGNVDQCHLVVTKSADRLSVWNLLTLALTWTVPLKVAHLCADPLSTYMAAFTQNNQLFIFTPGSSSPVFHEKHLINNKNNKKLKIVAANFVPRLAECPVGGLLLDWQKLSQLYFIDSNQELFCIETESETMLNTTNALEYTAEPQRSAFSALIAQTTTSATEKSEPYISPDSTYAESPVIKQLLAPPVHTLAPMRLLCASVLRSFVMQKPQKTLQTKDTDTDKDDNTNTNTNSDNDNDSSVEDTKKDSDSESETSSSKRPIIKKLKGKSQQPKVKKENLQTVLNEELKWTSALID